MKSTNASTGPLIRVPLKGGGWMTFGSEPNLRSDAHLRRLEAVETGKLAGKSVTDSLERSSNPSTASGEQQGQFNFDGEGVKHAAGE